MSNKRVVNLAAILNWLRGSTVALAAKCSCDAQKVRRCKGFWAARPLALRPLVHLAAISNWVRGPTVARAVNRRRAAQKVRECKGFRAARPLVLRPLVLRMAGGAEIVSQFGSGSVTWPFPIEPAVTTSVCSSGLFGSSGWLSSVVTGALGDGYLHL